MKKFLVIILFFTSLTALHAQKLGVRAGLILDNSKIEYSGVDTDQKVGFNVGAACDISLPLTGFKVNMALLYANRGFSLKSANETSGLTFHFKKHNIELPIVLHKGFNLGLVSPFVQGGVYGTYTLSGKVKNGESSQSIDYKDTSDKINMGALLGLGCDFVYGIRVKADYSYGFTDNKIVFGDSSVSDKDRRLTVSLEYYF